MGNPLTIDPDSSRSASALSLFAAQYNLGNYTDQDIDNPWLKNAHDANNALGRLATQNLMNDVNQNDQERSSQQQMDQQNASGIGGGSPGGGGAPAGGGGSQGGSPGGGQGGSPQSSQGHDSQGGHDKDDSKDHKKGDDVFNNTDKWLAEHGDKDAADRLAHTEDHTTSDHTTEDRTTTQQTVVDAHSGTPDAVVHDDTQPATASSATNVGGGSAHHEATHTHTHAHSHTPPPQHGLHIASNTTPTVQQPHLGHRR